MVNIDKILASIEEATVEQDRKFYDEAEKFYDDMVMILKRGDYIKQDDGNMLMKGSKVDLDYRDLLILFVNVEEKKVIPQFKDEPSATSYSSGTYEDKKVIIIPNLRTNEKNPRDNNNPSKRIDKNHFIHEFIHYLDSRRSFGTMPSSAKKDTKKEYFNTGSEMNAYYQEGIIWFTKSLENPDVLKVVKEMFPNYNKFWEWAKTKAFDSNFIKNVTPENEKKLKKRLYTVWDKYFVEKADK